MGVTKPHLIKLGAILHEIDNFDISEFDGHLILQKTIHMLKSFGIDLEYDFKWYFHGLYSQRLIEDGLELVDHYDDIPSIHIQFESAETQKRYEKFLRFMADKKNNSVLLDIASTTCYLHKVGFTESEVLYYVENTNSKFNAVDCRRIWNELKEAEVLKMEVLEIK